MALPRPDDPRLARALRLLARVPHGHAAVTRRALPWALPAGHRVEDGGTLLLRVTADVRELDGSVAAYAARGDAAGERWDVHLVGTLSLIPPDRHHLRLTPRLATVTTG